MKIVLVNQMLHTARRAKALGYGYEARLRGLELCDILLTNTDSRTNSEPSAEPRTENRERGAHWVNREPSPVTRHPSPHVRDDLAWGPAKAAWDIGFQFWGAIMLVVGWLLIRRVRQDEVTPPGESMQQRNPP